jgi:hypothetical protein
MRWPRRDLGVLLHDGVGELALGAVLDLYSGSYAARPHLVAAERKGLRSQHGLRLVPRYSARTAPTLGRVVLPAGGDAQAAARAAQAWSEARPERRVEDIHGTLPGAGPRAGSVYDATVRDLARSDGRGVARGAAKALFYALDEAALTMGEA